MKLGRQNILRVECLCDDTDDNKEYTVTFVNKKKPAIEVTKIDAETPTLKLEGAVFRITDTSTNNYWDIKTGADGTALLEGLEIGTTYVVEELEAPEGYLNGGYRQEIVLKESRTHTLTVANSKMPALKLIKKDKMTGAPLADATFRISWNSGADYQDVTTGKDGTATITGLKDGWYFITEIAAPDGYNIDTASHEVTIEFGQSYKIELTNTPKSPIYIGKVDEKGEPLAGAKFRVATMNGAMVGNVTSGRTGFAIIPYAEPDWYVIEEVQAPDGYVLSSTPVNVEVKSGKPAQVEFENSKKPMLQILKLDASPSSAGHASDTIPAGRREWVTAKDAWVTIIYAKPRGKLPQTSW